MSLLCCLAGQATVLLQAVKRLLHKAVVAVASWIWYKLIPEGGKTMLEMHAWYGFRLNNDI